MAKDYYKILGLERSASLEEIKSGYRKMSKKLHPDKHKGDKDVENKFKEVNEAYETLKDPKKKQMYDQFGSTGNQTGGAGGFDFSGFNTGGGFSDIFENFFSGSREQPGRPSQKGGDIEVEISINFTDAVSGMQREISIDKQVTCKTCKGSGADDGTEMESCSGCKGTGQQVRTQQSFFGTIQQSVVCGSCNGSGKVPKKPCSHCKGEGRRVERDNISIEVPAGVHDTQTLRIRGKGQAGRQGQDSGDLYVHIRVPRDHRFHREADDIHTSVLIPVVDAILGSSISVETVHGPVSLKIPEGTQPGQVFRIKGKGMPVVNSSRKGDHFVTANVEVPKKLNKKEKKILEEWKKQSS
ncbi:molecular chaperone DnaJ [Candidatus Peregrinibacteria bacterium]|jgi:molecular chaperone DnaJ|nr:molecular chaperone DnaJ [Candidatus Peregrinibacteria bacterium]MBT3598541.1 molecular chaperone DnaJ [Candidatus Peregrinibacteria bacterium]MBT4367648.1 molecular chaperone DnaJ [Candidatus Peregrinibacteria bacterium]MBT4586202.1 molecular chaperone DnaJ [Candidatus Peregrinibacteria bacterium]MBT6730491.1 molecular chaperone DnaJ [Candidatus Peregrinibacteria bacterium]